MYKIFRLSLKATPLKFSNRRCISTSDFIGTDKERSRFWIKAKPMVLSLLFGSMALQVQWCKEAYHDYVRETDTRVQLLKERISAAQAQLEGKEHDQNIVPRGLLFGETRKKIDMPEIVPGSSSESPKTVKERPSQTSSEARFL